MTKYTAISNETKFYQKVVRVYISYRPDYSSIKATFAVRIFCSSRQDGARRSSCSCFTHKAFNGFSSYGTFPEEQFKSNTDVTVKIPELTQYLRAYLIMQIWTNASNNGT